MMHFFKLLYPYRKTKAFVYRIKRIFLDFNSGNFKIADAISSGRNEGRKNTTISFPELQKKYTSSYYCILLTERRQLFCF